ncbi:MAG: AI-2E family transporter [Chloroflexi bacterium]|nr:AI-2E family transporter [Chloroflexota bacterium]
MAGADPQSPRWSTTAKALVALASLAIIAALLVRFQSIVPLLIVAGIVSYLSLPFVRALHHRARLSWTASTNIIFLYWLALLVVGSTAAGLAVAQQLQALLVTLQNLLEGLPAQLAALSAEPIVLGPWTLELATADVAPLVERGLSAIEPLFTRASTVVATGAAQAVESVAGLIFVLAVSYFLTVDRDRVRSSWRGINIPRYEYDITRLRTALARIWHAFLRGQLLIVLVMAVLMTVLMSILGVRFAIGLGALMGVAKFVPIVGPFSAGAAAALVALFQPTNPFGLTPVAFALVVIACTTILDQLVDYLLVPRILGGSLNLHPVIILVGAIVGATLFGVIGLLLSAPAMATLMLLARYAYRKLVDLSPWDPPIDSMRPWTPPRLPRLWPKRQRRDADQDAPPSTE